LKVIHI